MGHMHNIHFLITKVLIRYLDVGLDKSQERLDDTTLDGVVPTLGTVSSNVTKSPDSLVHNILMFTRQQTNKHGNSTWNQEANHHFSLSIFTEEGLSNLPACTTARVWRELPEAMLVRAQAASNCSLWFSWQPRNSTSFGTTPLLHETNTCEIWWVTKEPLMRRLTRWCCLEEDSSPLKGAFDKIALLQVGSEDWDWRHFPQWMGWTSPVEST